MALRTLLVDDSPAFLAAAERFLAAAGVAVVGRATSGREALAQADLLRPDLVLLDIGLPDVSGLEVARRLRARGLPPRIIMVTLSDAGAYEAAACDAGAAAVVAKGDFADTLPPLVARLFPGA